MWLRINLALSRPQIVDCDSHQLDKVNYFNHRPNTRTTRQRIEELIEFCNSWCGSYYIRVRDWLSCIQMAHCKITTQLSQTMLGSASHYRDYVQCHSRDWETWHTCFNIQRVHDRIRSPNNGEYEFWFCPDDIKCYVNGNMKKYVLDWPI